MADRHHPSQPPRAGAPSVSSNATAAAAGGNHARPRSGIAASNVRRNLFQSQLTRRPTPSNSASTSTETLRLDLGGGGGGGVAAGGAAAAAGDELLQLQQEETDDIVIRDQNGEIEFDDPPLPAAEDADEVVLDARQENEKERQRLAEAVKQHRIDQNSVPAQPEELLEAVKASLRAKVAALADDNWMYEREDIPRRH